MVLITGASGQVGVHLLRTLSAKGISTRAWIHGERNKEVVLAAGANEVFIGDLNSRDDAVRATNGIDTIYYICNTANPKEDEIGVNLIETAKERGNITFIYHSVMHSLLSDMPHHKKNRQSKRPWWIPVSHISLFNRLCLCKCGCLPFNPSKTEAPLYRNSIPLTRQG